jgi:hypothetical protein
VIVLEWTDPLFSMGNWGPELVEAANGRVLLGEKGQYSQAIAWDAVREADPEQGGRAWQKANPQYLRRTLLMCFRMRQYTGQ